MKTFDLTIRSFEDFQKYLDEFNIDWTSNTGGFVRKILRSAYEQGAEICTLRLSDAVIPPSYIKSAGAKCWKKRTLDGKVPYPFVQTSHPWGCKTLIVQASMHELPAPKWRTDILQRLRNREEPKLYIPLNEVPKTYIKQPYLLRTILRREGFRNATTLNIGNSLLITYEKTTKQSATVYSPE